MIKSNMSVVYAWYPFTLLCKIAVTDPNGKHGVADCHKRCECKRSFKRDHKNWRPVSQ